MHTHLRKKKDQPATINSGGNSHIELFNDWSGSNKKSGMKIAHAHGRGVTFSLGCMQEKFFAVSLVDQAREWKASRGLHSRAESAE
jgi:hypothetical protein